MRNRGPVGQTIKLLALLEDRAARVHVRRRHPPKRRLVQRSCPLRGKPGLKDAPQVAEGGIPTGLHGRRAGNLAKYPRRTLPSTSRRCTLHRRPHGLLRIGRLGAAGLPEIPGAQTATETGGVFSPAEGPGSLCQVTPDPCFELGLDDDGLRATGPAVPRQVSVHLALDFRARTAASASITVEQHEAALVALQKGPQKVRCARSTSAITVRVSPDFESKGPELQVVSPWKQCLDSFLEVLVSDEHDQVYGVDDLVHPITPVANSASVSTDPCQSRRMGWSLPWMISVAPSSSFAKHSTSCGSESLRNAGE